jgi:hypothetical protein
MHEPAIGRFVSIFAVHHLTRAVTREYIYITREYADATDEHTTKTPQRTRMYGDM